MAGRGKSGAALLHDQQSQPQRRSWYWRSNGLENLKAIAVEGTKGVNIADRKEMKRLNDYMMTELIGANNNHVVPSTRSSGRILFAKLALDGA